MEDSQSRNNPPRPVCIEPEHEAVSRQAYSPQALPAILFQRFGFRDGVRFIVAYSGGCDSQVLLHSLTDALRGTGRQVAAAHFNHRLQPESGHWVELCRHWAESLGVDFVTGQALTKGPPGAPGQGKNVEAWARDERYQWLSRIAHEGDVVLTAHHADDQAETFLMNLFQGRGIPQLAGISPHRPIVYGSTTSLARPLLGFTRRHLGQYARQHNLSWIEDPSNDSVSRYRNLLRHGLIPMLCKRSPDLIERLNTAANQCRIIAGREIEVFDRLYRQSADPDASRIFCLADPLNTDNLTGLDPFEFNGLIRHWLHKSGRPSPGNRKLAEFYRQLRRHAEHPQLSLGRQVIRKFGPRLYLTRAFTTRRPAPIDWDLRRLEVPQYHIRIQVKIGLNQGLSRPRVEGAQLKWVWRQGGERIRLPDRRHSASVKKLLQSSRVPPWERDHLPMLAVNGEIAWVRGVGVSDGFTVTPGEEGIYPCFSSVND